MSDSELPKGGNASASEILLAIQALQLTTQNGLENAQREQARTNEELKGIKEHLRTLNGSVARHEQAFQENARNLKEHVEDHQREAEAQAKAAEKAEAEAKEKRDDRKTNLRFWRGIAIGFASPVVAIILYRALQWVASLLPAMPVVR
jgi:chromatin remodeling complex protein RSC6